MAALITLAIILFALICLGPVGVAIIAGLVALLWGAVQLTLWLAGATLGAIVFPIWWLLDRGGAMAAWRAGRSAR